VTISTDMLQVVSTG